MDRKEAIELLDEVAEYLPDCHERLREALNIAVRSMIEISKKDGETYD